MGTQCLTLPLPVGSPQWPHRSTLQQTAVAHVAATCQLCDLGSKGTHILGPKSPSIKRGAMGTEEGAGATGQPHMDSYFCVCHHLGGPAGPRGRMLVNRQEGGQAVPCPPASIPEPSSGQAPSSSRRMGVCPPQASSQSPSQMTGREAVQTDGSTVSCRTGRPHRPSPGRDFPTPYSHSPSKSCLRPLLSPNLPGPSPPGTATLPQPSGPTTALAPCALPLAYRESFANHAPDHMTHMLKTHPWLPANLGHKGVSCPQPAIPITSAHHFPAAVRWPRPQALPTDTPANLATQKGKLKLKRVVTWTEAA